MIVDSPFALTVVAATLALAATVPAAAGDEAPPIPASKAASIIATGSANVAVEGKAAARAGDQTTAASTAVEGSGNVIINGKPAVRAGDRTNCGGVVVGGSATVLVNGKPLATTGSTVSGCQ